MGGNGVNSLKDIRIDGLKRTERKRIKEPESQQLKGPDT